MKNLQSGLLYSLTGAAAVASLASCSAQKKAEEQKQYNIVYIMTDDHTAQMMSCYDHRYMETPNLDRIAADGVRFTNSFVANSLSGPSRACMITGKHSCANKFYDNTTCVFDASQQTFPKLLQQAGYETALIGKWHLESLPTGFNYWEIVPGQGDYYNPDFITQDNDTIQKHGYVTNLITDDAINWMENQRDKDKPFCILIHHKAIHRNWLADTCNLALYEDKTFPLPDNFFDDYEGRPAAAAQEMSIVKDMDMIYDLKMLRPDKETRLKALYEKYIGRMDEGQRAAWDKFYGPIIEDFYQKNPQGKELANWKFQRYMRDYMKTVKSLDDNVGRVLDYLKEKENLRPLGKKVVYTGPVDAYFDYCFGELEYRTVRFETEILDTDNYQGNAVVNYTEYEVPYTRIIEHKHFEFGTQEKTVISREYPVTWKKGDEPYYPVNDEKNTALYAKYKELAEKEENVIFGGRLGLYRYMDMHHVVDAALQAVREEMR